MNLHLSLFPLISIHNPHHHSLSYHQFPSMPLPHLSIGINITMIRSLHPCEGPHAPRKPFVLLDQYVANLKENLTY